MRRELAARAVYEVGTLVGPYPRLALPVARLRHHGEPVSPATDVVIEGFPRSANSLMVSAFVAAQPRPMGVAHHVHAPANAIEGVRRGLPTLVLIREPEDAVVELVLLKPALTVAQALRGWLRFYGPLRPHRRRFVVATTAEVTQDPAIAIRRLNERFATPFALPTSETAEGIRGYWQGRTGPGLPLIGRTTGTEADRDEDRERLRGRYRSSRLETPRRRAERLYRWYAGGSSELHVL